MRQNIIYMNKSEAGKIGALKAAVGRSLENCPRNNMIDQDFQKWFDELSQKREREKRYKEISDRVIKLENEMICEISRIENLKGENTI